MANNRIGCSAGKTSLIDPNNFSGQGSSDNISVPLEDLNISVQLSTFKKGRTLLTASKGVTSTESSKTVSVTFIEGTEVNGQKVLTSKFTDLTTVFDKDNDSSENLGITNIDVDFNSSYAPLITINFLDLRGSSIFQNESQLNNNENKYSVFFQLPYPLYELEIKGYYGQPVKYCLHMTKFNSKFNAQTGNFEITANFVGYTYAMLSDMLLGILKAIPYTKRGVDKYKTIKGEDKKVLNLNELMIEIGLLDNHLEKIGASDPDAGRLKVLKEMLIDLELMKTTINNLGKGIDYNTKKNDYEAYRFIVIQNHTRDLVTNYEENITNNIRQYNDKNTEASGSYSLYESEFNFLDPLLIYKKTLNTLDETTTPKYSDISDRRGEINYPTTEFDTYNMTSLFKKINIKKQDIEKEISVTENKLAMTIRKTLSDGLGFESTIRNVVNCFTVAVEVFLSIIYDVSKEAEEDKANLRKSELEKAFNHPESSDLKTEIVKKFYPWPDYRENSVDGYKEKYLGTYGVLKNPNYVTELEFIDDLYNGFITAKEKENEAVLEFNQENKLWIPINPFDTKLYNNKDPYTRISNASNVDDVLRLIILRATTFIGYTNNEDFLETTPDFISKMAESEAKAIINTNNLSQMTKQGVKNRFVNLTSNYNVITNVEGSINTIGGPVLTPQRTKKPTVIKPSIANNQNYYYDYIFSGPELRNVSGGITYREHQRVIPLSNGFTGDWEYDVNKLAKRGETDVFLTNFANYNPLSFGRNNPLKADDDGGRYISFSPLNNDINGYDKFKDMGLINDVGQTNNVITLNNLKNRKGYNVFGGQYGIQDFVNLDWEVTGLEGLPSRFLFYSNDVRDINGKVINSNTLNLNRKDSEIYKYQPFDTYYLTHQYTYSEIEIIPSTTIVPPFTTTPATPATTTVTTFQISSANNQKNSHFEKQKLLHKNYTNNRLFFKKYNDRTKLDYTYPYIEQRYSYKLSSLGGSQVDTTFSLFGSKLYYAQRYDNYAKALLFLNTLPFNGQSFEKPEIINMFNKVGGFIRAPRLWCAYIGGLLWRQRQFNLNGVWVDPIQWGIESGNISGQPPSYFQTFFGYNQPSQNDDFRFIRSTGSYNNSHDLIINGVLPKQVRDAFVNEFEKFVNGTDEYIINWLDLKDNLEIYDSEAIGNSYVDFRDTVNNMYDEAYNSPSKTINNNNYNKFKNIDKYSVIVPVDNLAYDKNSNMHNDGLFLELDGDATNNNAISYLITSMMEETVITNSGPNIWGYEGGVISNNGKVDIFLKEKNMHAYLDKMKSIFTDAKFTEEALTVKNKQDVFGTDSDEVVKLQLYRTCKNVYDKWIGGATDGDNIVFQCGNSGNNRNDRDKFLGKKRGVSEPKLIDSFRFVTRSFRDIGDDFFIDPRPVHTYLKDNPNSSFYGCITDLLASNNFDFIALPSFINYNEPSVMESIFEPYSYHEAISDGTCGPSFVCVYVGQKSKHLDFTGSDYTNDGFDIQCGNDGNMINKLPTDFTIKNETHENNVAVFKVAYSQQNQNIFKDIILDQSEFTETEESLKIIDDISKTGSENQRHFGGQNLYSVYGVRSYKAEVEMMGNAMIQPMMYFQLDNIPMFHGAYMITHVKHSIKPNSMSTNFTGVRIRHPETPILKANELYLSLLESISITATPTNPITAGCPIAANKNPFRTSGFNRKPAMLALLSGGGNIDEQDSIKGFKKVPFFYDSVTNKLTAAGTFALVQGVVEGIGKQPSCNNPGNIKGGTCGKGNEFKQYPTWEDGWLAYSSYLKNKIKTIGNSAGAKFADCYVGESNVTFQLAGIKFNPSGPYNNTGNEPTLRQYINVYAPWGDGLNNPSNYIAIIAATMKDFGYDISVDEKMVNYIK